MRKFAITVNGQSYEVEVEEIGGAPVFAAASFRWRFHSGHIPPIGGQIRKGPWQQQSKRCPRGMRINWLVMTETC